MQPPDSFDPPIGVAQELKPGLRRIVAPNASPMTYRGTNTYLIGHEDIAVLDPGPLDDTHLDAIQSALTPQQRIAKIIVSHSHLDHSPLARPLAEKTGAPVLAYGNSTAGRSEVMRQLATQGYEGGGEGIDKDFRPDRLLTDGETIMGSGWALEVIHTPGHLGNHICLGWQDCCFTGDHVMGWASSLVSPPDGDLTDFMASCARLSRNTWTAFFPGHGDVIDEPQKRLDWLVAHRKAREASIVGVLKDGPSTATELTERIYTDTPRKLLPAARRNVIAHLIDLIGQSTVQQNGSFDPDGIFSLVERR